MRSTRGSALKPEDLLALVEMGREVAAELDLRTLLARILARACELTDSPDSSVILHDPERGDLYFAAATGKEAPELLGRWGTRRQKGIPIEGSKAGEVFTTGRSVVVAAVEQDPSHFRGVDADTDHQTRSMLCVPLAVGGERLGVMQLLNKREGSFTERDIILLEHFAAHAAVALRNANLLAGLLAHMGWYASQADLHDPARLLETLRRPARHAELTLFFADLRGYNRLCQLMDRPEQMQRILDEFLTRLTRGVLEHNGIVNKFLGDGLLALFQGESAAVNAVQCAAALVSDMHRLRDRWNAGTNVSLGFLDIGIGIATDTVILGSIGTERVRDFTVMGTGVNLAAHLTRDARHGRRILIDKRTFLQARHLIADYEGPEVFDLRKPDQPHGRAYERYWVRGLAASPEAVQTSASAPAAARPAPISTARDGVFISYSHRDTAWLELLQTHLRPYVRGKTVSVFDDTQIRPGADWRAEIGAALGRARVAVLLVSPHFLESEFVAAEEWPALLAAAERRGLTVIWFALSACSYTETDIERYQAALDPSRPLDGLAVPQQHEALVRVCQEIKKALSHT